MQLTNDNVNSLFTNLLSQIEELKKSNLEKDNEIRELTQHNLHLINQINILTSNESEDKDKEEEVEEEEEIEEEEEEVEEEEEEKEEEEEEEEEEEKDNCMMDVESISEESIVTIEDKDLINFEDYDEEVIIDQINKYTKRIDKLNNTVIEFQDKSKLVNAYYQLARWERAQIDRLENLMEEETDADSIEELRIQYINLHKPCKVNYDLL
jgi:hypothetical protein